MGADCKSLNEYQERSLLVSCKHIDSLLADMEATLNSGSSRTPFPKYISDVWPAQQRLIEDYISRMRAELVRVLKNEQVDVPAIAIPVSRSLYTALTFIEIDVEELKPKYMRGYGEVSDTLARELNGIVAELSILIRKLDRILTQERTDCN